MMARASDLIALDCIDELTAAGLRVPEDASVVGANDIPFLPRMSPALFWLDKAHKIDGESSWPDINIDDLLASYMMIRAGLIARISSAFHRPNSIPWISRLPYQTREIWTQSD